MAPANHAVVLLTRPGCHLCTEARAVLQRVAGELGVSWQERDISTDEQLSREYADWVPVTLVDGVGHDYWRLDESRLRAALAGQRA